MSRRRKDKNNYALEGELKTKGKMKGMWRERRWETKSGYTSPRGNSSGNWKEKRLERLWEPPKLNLLRKPKRKGEGARSERNKGKG